jgi:predicted nucleic acid-binding protein
VKILLDSSGWIELFIGGPLAERYAAYLAPRYDVITPTIVLYEVYKKIKRERGEATALVFSGRLGATHVVQLTEPIAYLAADLSLRHGLAMADAIVYATAKDQEAEVITGDADLKDLPGVIYVSKGNKHARTTGCFLTSRGTDSSSKIFKMRWQVFAESC